MWLLCDSMHPQVWAGFYFFLQKAAWCSTRLPPQKKKLLCKSHSSLNSEWWAVLTLKPGSEQSLAYIFQEICDSYCGFGFFSFMLLSEFTSHVYFAQVGVFPPTGACCSFAYLSILQMLPCNTQGEIPFNVSHSAVVMPSSSGLIGSFHSSYIQFVNLIPARLVFLTQVNTKIYQLCISAAVLVESTTHLQEHNTVKCTKLN